MARRIVLLLSFGLLLLMGLSVSVQAQNINQKDFSNIQVDELTDAQVRQLMKQAEAAGMNADQLTVIAESKGMDPDEIDKLKKRVEKLQSTTQSADRKKNGTRKVNYVNEVE